MDVSIVFSAILGLGALALREYFKTRNLVGALVAEATDARRRIMEHFRDTDWERAKLKIAEDPEYTPYLTQYPPPHHLYREAIDEAYMLPQAPTRSVLLAHKAEMVCENLINGRRSPEVQAFSGERKAHYIDLIQDKILLLDQHLEDMLSS